MPFLFICVVWIVCACKINVNVIFFENQLSAKVTTMTDDKDFLYYGDMWEALLGEDRGKSLSKIIVETTHYGKAVAAAGDFSFLEYKPKNSLIAFEAVIGQTDGQNSLYSIFPVLPGYPNRLIFNDVQAMDEDNAEGHILLSKGNAAPMWMFNPLFGQQYEKLRQNVGADKGKQRFMLAGLGWNIEKMSETIIKFEDGAYYEDLLQEFLRENPGKSKDDFPYAELDISRGSVLLSQKYVDMYEFASDIYGIEEFKYAGETFYRLVIRVLQGSEDEEERDEDDEEEENCLSVYLYVNKKELGKYVPKIGDHISGFMQLNAYIRRNYAANPSAPRLEDPIPQSFFDYITELSAGYVLFAGLSGYYLEEDILYIYLLYPIFFIYHLIKFRKEHQTK